MYKDTPFALLPTEFFVLVTRKSPLIECFASVLSKRYNKLIATFPNLKTIILEIDARVLEFASADVLIRTVCGDDATCADKSIHLTVSNIPYEWSHELHLVAPVFVNVNVLSLSVNRSWSEDIRRSYNISRMLRSPKHWTGLSYWKNVTRLELLGFGPSIDTILQSSVAAGTLSRLSHLAIDNDPYFSTITDEMSLFGPRPPPPSQGIGPASHLYKCCSLKSISLGYYRSSADADSNSISTIWTTFGSKESTVQLESINVRRMDMTLLTYLNGGYSTRSASLQRLNMVAGIHPLELLETPGNLSPSNTNNYINLANVFYIMTLPTIQITIKELSFICTSYLDFAIPNIKPYIATYAAINKHFSFTDRELNYDFASLERLGAWLQYSDGCFSSFMRAIRSSPKLQHIDLHVEVVDLPGYSADGDGDGDTSGDVSLEGTDDAMANVAGLDDVWNDVLEFFDHGVQWTKGKTTMDVEVTTLLKRQRERRCFVWSGRSWIALV